MGCDLGVALSTFQLVKALEQGTASAGETCQARGVGDTTDENSLLSIALGGLLRSDVDLDITSHSWDASQVVVVLKTSQFEQVVESRAHTTADWILLETITLGEGVIARVLLALSDENSHSADTEHVELVFVGINGSLEFLNAGAVGEGTDLQGVDGTLAGGISLDRGTAKMEKSI